MPSIPFVLAPGDEWRAATNFFAGLNAGGKLTAVCIVDEAGKIVWQDMMDTHPDIRISSQQHGSAARVSSSGLGLKPARRPHLYRELAAQGFAMVCMDARRAADAIKSRRIKSDAGALAEMLRTGGFTAAHVKSVDSHRIKTLPGAHDQLARIKRSLGNQIRGLLRPFGIKLPSRVGSKRFAEATHQATQNDPLMHASIAALLEALVSIDAQTGKLDDELKEFAKRDKVCWLLMSVPGIGPITALAFRAAIEDPRADNRTPIVADRSKAGGFLPDCYRLTINA